MGLRAGAGGLPETTLSRGTELPAHTKLAHEAQPCCPDVPNLFFCCGNNRVFHLGWKCRVRRTGGNTEGGESKRTAREMDRVYPGNAVQNLKVRRLGGRWAWLDEKRERKERRSAAISSLLPCSQTLTKSIVFK